MQNKKISTENQIQQYLYYSKDCFQFLQIKSVDLPLSYTHFHSPPSQERNGRKEKDILYVHFKISGNSIIPTWLKHALDTGQMNAAGNIKYWAVGWTDQQLNVQCVWYKHNPAEYEQPSWLKTLKI